MSSPKQHTARSILDKFYEEERKYMSAAPEDRVFQPIADILAPDYRLEQTSGLPYAGVYNGADGMQDWIRQMADYFDVVDVQNPEIYERDSSNRIVVLGNLHLRVRKSGVEADYPFCQVVTVDLEKGHLVRMQPFYWDVHDLNRLIGHSPR